MLLFSGSANAAKAKKKKRKNHSLSRLKKNSKHSRRYRHYRHGNGPELKAITIDSPYKEDPTNGINPIEESH